MKILILNWRDPKNPKGGGAEIVTLEHAKRWVEKGYEVTWFTSAFKGCERRETLNGINIIRWGNYITVYLLAPIFYFLSHGKFDIVIDEIHGIPFLTPIYVRKPKIVIIHEVADSIWNYMFPWPINIIGRFSEKFYFKIYKNMEFLVPSKSTRHDLVQKGIPRTKINMFYCGVNKPPLLSLQKEKNPTFIFISRLVKMKGIQNVIDSFCMIKIRLPNAKLWVVGDGDKDDVSRFKLRVRESGLLRDVIFFGRVSEKKKFELMRRAHILLHASVREGWGLVVIEAASQKTPSVVYNVGGLRDSVINNKTGIVIKNNTPLELSNQAVQLYEDKKTYKRLQRESLEWVNFLTWERSVSSSLKLIRKLTKDYV